MDYLKNRVRSLLFHLPCTRNDDFILWLEYVKEFAPYAVDDKGHLIPEYLHALPTQHTLARLRATIQNRERQFMPTCLQVVRGRRQAAESWAAWNREEKLKVMCP